MTFDDNLTGTWQRTQAAVDAAEENVQAWAIAAAPDDFGCCVCALHREGRHRIVAGVSDREIAVGDEGTFALYLSAAPPPPHLRRTDWIRLTRSATMVIIRQLFLRRLEQSPACFDIVCLDSRRSTATTYRRTQAPHRSPRPNSSTPQ